MRRLVLVVLLLSAGGASAEAKVIGKVVEYAAGATAMKGYLAYDDAVKGPRPGVLVVHEWWGLNAYARKRAELLAKMGYTALAVDMFGDGKQASHPDEAGKFVAEVTKHMPVAEKRFRAALELLGQQATVAPGRIAAIGYCFGGGVVLHMARIGLPLRGVVSFHGSLGATVPPKRGAVTAKVLVFTGGADPFVPAELVSTFEQAMKQAGADAKVVTFPGVKHSFTNPDANAMGKMFKLPLAYDQKADRASWAETSQFLAKLFAR